MSRTAQTLLRFNKEEEKIFDDLVKFYSLQGIPITSQIRVLLNTLHDLKIKKISKE